MANELTPIRGGDNFSLAAEASTGSAITGERLRFSKGLYLIGRGDSAQLSAGTKLRVLDVAAGWVKFFDGKVVDQRMGYPLCERGDLDDNDPEDWPSGYDGSPSDPWSNQRYLYLVDPVSGAEFTFITSSWGGRAAVEALARQVHIKRGAAPGAVALVQLDTAYKKSAKYGNIPSPKFVVVGWTDGDGRPIAENANSNFRVISGRSAGEELDDEIPF